MKLKFDRHQIQFRYNYDSFGNALGNAAVKAIRDYKSEPTLQDKINKSFKKISEKLSANTDGFTRDLIRKNAAEDITKVETLGTKNLKPIDDAIAAENDEVLAENQRKRNANVEKANAYSDQLNKQAAELGGRHQAMKDRIQPTLDRTKYMLNDWTEVGLNVDPSLSPSTDIGPFRNGYRFADSQAASLTNFIPEGSIEAALRGDFLNLKSNQNVSELTWLPSNQFNSLALLSGLGEIMARNGYIQDIKAPSASSVSAKKNLNNIVNGVYTKPPIEGLNSKYFASAFGWLGKQTTYGSYIMSGINTAESVFAGTSGNAPIGIDPERNGYDSGDMFRDVGKFGVDTVATIPTVFGKVAGVARLTPVGLAYTAADIVVQTTPSYTIKYGEFAGQTRDGWTKLYYAHKDHQQRLQQMSVEEFTDYQNYRPQPKF